MTTRTCELPDCDKPHKGRGMCNAHHRRWLRYGNPTNNQRPTRGVCQLDGCEQPHKARGMCQTHYRQWLRTNTTPKGACTLDGCDNPHRARGMCNRHYQQWTRNGQVTTVAEPRPLARLYYAEEVEHLASFGTPPERIVTALGVTPAALARALYRAGRNDLANPFQALTRQTQKKEAA